MQTQSLVGVVHGVCHCDLYTNINKGKLRHSEVGKGIHRNRQHQDLVNLLGKLMSAETEIKCLPNTSQVEGCDVEPCFSLHLRTAREI
jgi:hypothetical protein